MAALASVVTMVKMNTGFYMRLYDLSTVDTRKKHPYIFGFEGDLQEIDGTDTHIAYWDGPYQVFQERGVLGTYGSIPTDNTGT